MSGTADRTRDELFETIDREAESPDESRDSKQLFDELRARRDRLSGSKALPAEDPELNDRIRAAATKRSHELQGVARPSASLTASQRDEGPVPWWLWVAWALAIAAAVAGFIWIW